MTVAKPSQPVAEEMVLAPDAGASGPDDIHAVIFESLGVGVFQSTLDGRFVRVNGACARLYGYADPDQLLAGVRDGAFEFFHADPRDRLGYLAQLASEGRVEGRLFRLRRRDGSEFWGSGSASLLRDAAGRPAWIVGTVADVSDVVARSDALVAAERDHRSIFESATVGIYRSTPDGRQLRANPALVRLNGFESEAEMLAAVRDIAHDWYVDPHRRDAFKRAMARHGHVANFESEIHRYGSRERIWVRETAWAIKGPDRTPLFYEGIVEEITAEKAARADTLRARRETERAHAAKAEFLANISHELRTPLTAIMGFAEMMGRGTFGPIGNPRYESYVGLIRESAGHLAALVDDVLDLSKHEAGKVELAEEDVDVGALAAAVTPMLEARARDSGVALVTDIAPGLPALRVDRRRMLQVLLNLLSNAVKFTPSGGRVTLAARRGENGAFVLEATDTGIGIPAKHLERVFEPFVQLRAAGAAAPREGTGLGLPLARRLVALHGGTLTLASEVGRGTTARVTLPAHRLRRVATIPPAAN